MPSHAIALATVLALLVCTSCHSQPAQPRSLYRLSSVEAPPCAHRVTLLTAAQMAADEYRELAHLSATCPPISPTTCERVLLARACDIGADTVVITQTTTIGTKGKPEQVDEATAFSAIQAAQP